MKQNYNLNLIPHDTCVYVRASQYDKGTRTINMTVFNGISLYNIPAGSVVTVRGTKPQDNTGFEYECTYSGAVVSFDIQEQMTVFAGKVPAEIRITKDEKILGSANFFFNVEPAPLTDDTVISETQLPLLEQALQAAAEAEQSRILAETAKDSAEESATNASESEANALTYSQNAQASANSASQSATNASQSATNASNSATNSANSATQSANSATIATTNALKSEGYAVGEQNGEPVDETSIYYHNNAKWYSEHGGGGDASWGSITGNISNQTDLIEKFDEVESSIPTKTSDLTNDSGFISSIPSEYVTDSELNTALSTKADTSSLSTVATSGSYNDLLNKPTIPTKTSELTNNSNFVSDANYVHTDNNFTTAEKTKLNGISSGAEVNVQSDWNVTNTSSDAYIKNKPTIPTKTSDLTNDSGFITSVPVSSVNGRTGAVTGLQETSNLVTSVSSSSTNTQYPSAKCLYDLVGDIETLLASI